MWEMRFLDLPIKAFFNGKTIEVSVTDASKVAQYLNKGHWHSFGTVDVCRAIAAGEQNALLILLASGHANACTNIKVQNGEAL